MCADPVYRVMISNNDFTDLLRWTSPEPIRFWTPILEHDDEFGIEKAVHVCVLGKGLAGRGKVISTTLDDRFKLELSLLLPVPISLEVIQPYYLSAHYCHPGDALEDEDARLECAVLAALRWAAQPYKGDFDV